VTLNANGINNPRSSKYYSHIFTTNDYFTKWQEVVALKRVISEQLITFLKDNFLSRFGVHDFFFN
jgi:hypothetical protein